MANKKINTGSLSTSIKDPKAPKLTSDILADYLKMMGGEPMLVRPDGSQYNPDRKGRVNIGDRMTTAEKFGQAADVGLSNDFMKLPEVQARFDDRRLALQVQKELSTGRLTTQKFYEVPTKEVANQVADEIRRSPELLGRGESVEVRPAGKGFEVVAVKQYQPIPSRGNSLVRSYSLNNDPTGVYVAFNKPEEAYKAPPSLKELQANTRKAYQTFGLKPNATMAELEAAVQPIVSEVKGNPELRDRLATVLVDMKNRPELEPVPLERGWDKVQSRSPMTQQVMQQAAIASEPKATLSNTARDTGGWANAVGEPYEVSRKQTLTRDQILKADADANARYGVTKPPNFAAEMGLDVNPNGLSDRSAYNRIKATYEADNFGLGDRLKPFPDFYELKRQAKAEGVRDEAFQNYIKGKANAPLIEAGVMRTPELPMTARLGQEYISPKTGKIGTVESVGKKGVKLNVDGQTIPVEYQTLERLKYTGNKGFGISANTAMDLPAKFAKGFAMREGARLLAKQLGADEQQQQAVADTVTAANVLGSVYQNVTKKSGAFSQEAIAPDVRERIQELEQRSPVRGLGVQLYDDQGSTTGINALLREKQTGMDRHVSDFDTVETRQFAANLQDDLRVLPTKPQITYRGMVENATDFRSGYRGAGGSGERLAESIGLKPDRPFYDKAFMATTPNRDYADRYGKDITLEVMGSAGYKMPTRHADMGGEVLYPAGNQFDVENYRVVDIEHHVIDPFGDIVETSLIKGKVTARLVDRNLSPDEVVQLKRSLLKEGADSFPSGDRKMVDQLKSFFKQFSTLEDARAAQKYYLGGKQGADDMSRFFYGDRKDYYAAVNRYQQVMRDFRDRFPSVPHWKFFASSEKDPIAKLFTDKSLRLARKEFRQNIGANYAGKFQESAIARPDQFEYGQKFQSTKTGNIVSLVSADSGVVKLQDTKGVVKEFPSSILRDNLQIKAPPTLTDLKRGDGLISNKSDLRYTVMETTPDAVKLRGEDGAIKTARKSQIPELFRPNTLGFGSIPALRPANAGLVGGTLGVIAFKQLAKAAGLNEDQQNIAAGVGGVTGAITGGSLSLFKPTTELKAPTPQQFARNVMGIPASSESGMFLTSEGRNKMRLNQLNQYDVKPVLGEAAVIATDLLTPSPYGIVTVPAARMATDSWKNNYDAIAERGLAAMKTSAIGATAAVRDFTYQTLSQLGRSVGLPFPTTEQAVGQVLDALPNSQQIAGMADRAKARLSRRYSSESGMVVMGDSFEKPKLKSDRISAELSKSLEREQLRAKRRGLSLEAYLQEVYGETYQEFIDRQSLVLSSAQPEKDFTFTQYDQLMSEAEIDPDFARSQYRAEKPLLRSSGEWYTVVDEKTGKEFTGWRDTNPPKPPKQMGLFDAPDDGKFPLKKIISGGQTGVDQIGLEVAKSFGIDTGGFAPPRFMTEAGQDVRLRDEYGLVDIKPIGNISAEMAQRTRQNARASDGTVIFTEDIGSKGTQRTIKEVGNRPLLVNPESSQQLRDFIQDNRIETLNVAGNRASKSSKATLDRARGVLADAISPVLPSMNDSLAGRTMITGKGNVVQYEGSNKFALPDGSIREVTDSQIAKMGIRKWGDLSFSSQARLANSLPLKLAKGFAIREGSRFLAKQLGADEQQQQAIADAITVANVAGSVYQNATKKSGAVYTVGGSRKLEGAPELVNETLRKATAGDKTPYFVLGDAKGVDSIAKQYAIDNNIPYRVMSANRTDLGNERFVVRDYQVPVAAKQIASTGAYGSDIKGIYLSADDSKGTQHMINAVMESGIPTEVTRVKSNIPAIPSVSDPNLSPDQRKFLDDYIASGKDPSSLTAKEFSKGVKIELQVLGTESGRISKDVRGVEQRIYDMANAYQIPQNELDAMKRSASSRMGDRPQTLSELQRMKSATVDVMPDGADPRSLREFQRSQSTSQPTGDRELTPEEFARKFPDKARAMGVKPISNTPVEMSPRLSSGEIFEVPLEKPRLSLSELQAARRELDSKYPDSPRYDRTAKPEPRKPVPLLTLDQAADQMSMSPSEYRAFQDRVYAEQQAIQSKPYQERQNQIAKQKFQQEQSYFDALRAWNKAGDPTIPMPRKEDFVSPVKNTFDFRQTLSEASMAARSAESRAKGFGKSQPKSAIAQATQAIKNAGEIVLDALYQPSAANPSRASSPKQSNFIAESTVEAAAKSSGASTAQIKAELANQRASGETPNLTKATEAIAQKSTRTNELAPRSLAEMQSQSKALSTRVLSRQQPDGMIATPSQGMIDAAMKQQNRFNLGDRIGASGLGLVMDTAQAANVLTESASRGENANVALTRAGVSVGAGYAATGLASFIPNPYLRTAAQLGGGIAAVVGADKAIDQVVGRDSAREEKFAKDLSKLDLQATKESEQWKPFADNNLLGAYGNSFVNQLQQNVDYRPAARSLANLANKDAIENARYSSERTESIEANQQLGAGGRKMTRESGKSIAWRDLGNGQTEAIMRDRGLTSQESRILAMQNLANESGYEVPRTGKLDTKTVDALKKLGYSTGQISEYIHGKSMTIGKPNQVTPDKVAAARIALARSRGEQVTSSQLSAALSAERKAQGLKAGQTLDQGTVNSVFQSLAGRSLASMQKVGGAKTQSALRMGAGLR